MLPYIQKSVNPSRARRPHVVLKQSFTYLLKASRILISCCHLKRLVCTPFKKKITHQSANTIYTFSVKFKAITIYEFDPWPGNFYVSRAQPKKQQKSNNNLEIVGGNIIYMKDKIYENDVRKRMINLQILISQVCYHLS